MECEETTALIWFMEIRHIEERIFGNLLRWKCLVVET